VVKIGGFVHLGDPDNFIGYDADGRVFTPPELEGLTAEEIASPDALHVTLKCGRQRLAREEGFMAAYGHVVRTSMILVALSLLTSVGSLAGDDASSLSPREPNNANKNAKKAKPERSQVIFAKPNAVSSGDPIEPKNRTKVERGDDTGGSTDSDVPKRKKSSSDDDN
jgi:hypothetical protein